MKPRKAVAFYTLEDADAWICVGLWQGFTLNDSLELSSAICDRRDAELMLEWQLYINVRQDHGRIHKSGIDYAGMVL